MKISKQAEYLSILEMRRLPIQLLIAIVAVIEPKISKAAYRRTKYLNANVGGDEGFYTLIKIRNEIHHVLKKHYTLEQLKAEASKVHKDMYTSQKRLMLLCHC